MGNFYVAKNRFNHLITTVEQSSLVVVFFSFFSSCLKITLSFNLIHLSLCDFCLFLLFVSHEGGEEEQYKCPSAQSFSEDFFFELIRRITDIINSRLEGFFFSFSSFLAFSLIFFTFSRSFRFYFMRGRSRRIGVIFSFHHRSSSPPPPSSLFLSVSSDAY